MKRFAILLALGMPASVFAQDTVLVNRGRMPSSRMVMDAVALYNASTTTRFRGTHTIASGEVVSGDVGVLRGQLRIEGEVNGAVAVINGDVDLASSADIHGDLLVIGGNLTRDDGSNVRGTIRLHSQSVNVRYAGEQIEIVESVEPLRPRPGRPVRNWPRFGGRGSGDADIVIGTGGTYNRVEGLPLRGGLRIRWESGNNSGRIEGFGIFRTAGDFTSSREDIGYRASGSLRFGAIEFGAGAFDEVVPMSTLQLENDEIALAAFLWHRDYRDYYLNRGWLGYLSLRPFHTLTLTGEYADVEDRSIAARDPWTLFRNSEAWRPNPVIDEGNFTRLTARLEFDSRYGVQSSGSGWLLRAEWQRGESDDISPLALSTTIRAPIRTDTTYRYDWASIDLRRYQNIGWGGQLRLRALVAGTVGAENDAPLPVQLRQALGGPGLMPGYEFRRFRCDQGTTIPGQPALCDRMLLFQAEYRGDLSFGLFGDNWDHRTNRLHHWDDWQDWLDFDWFEGPELVLFGNAGSAWLHPNDPDDFKFDVGAGIQFGSFGIYAARALESSAPIRFSLRLHHRF